MRDASRWTTGSSRAGRLRCSAVGARVVLACTAGPKSALAVDHLLQFGVDAVAVAGGLKGWDAGGLELVDAFEEDEDDEDEEDEDDDGVCQNLERLWPLDFRFRVC